MDSLTWKEEHAGAQGLTRWFTAAERCGVWMEEKVGLDPVPGGSSVSHMKRLFSKCSHSSLLAPLTAYRTCPRPAAQLV